MTKQWLTAAERNKELAEYDGVLISKTDSGTGIFMCQKCRKVLQEAFGAQNKDQLVYVLICPNCMHIAGQVAFDGDNIWVSNGCVNTVSKL